MSVLGSPLLDTKTVKHRRPMKTKIVRSWKHAILVKEIDLKGITESVSQYYSESTFEVHCNEGSRITFQSLNDLLEYENPNFRRIESISMYFDTGGRECRVLIRLSVSGSDSCGIHIEDNDDSRSFNVANEIEKRLRSCKPWYSFLLRFSLSTYFLIALLAIATIMTWVQAFSGDLKESQIPLIYKPFIYLPFLIVIGIIFIVLDKVWEWIFPKVWFCIGRQKDELEKRSSVRSKLLIGIGLALLVGIAANLITNTISM